MSRQIPDRWIPYKAFGKVIEGTRIICFKVPLRKKVQINPEIKNIWDIETLISSIPKIGAVIDLTNTSKYYNPKDFTSKGILYEKILMEGHRLPPEQTVKKFINIVDGFLKKDKESLVGVHCTHGLNRTGYMVCRYMRDRLGIPPKDAIQRFEVARGYPIERDVYIVNLLHEKGPETEETTKLNPIEKPVQNGFSKKRKSSASPPRKKNKLSESSTSSYEFDYINDY